MSNEVFEFSRLPRQLEWYKCYDDPANAYWIDGREYLDHPEWDDMQKQKWRFFYRPHPSAIGRPQKKRIHDGDDRIAQARAEIADMNRQLLLNGALAAVCVALSLWVWGYLVVLPIGFFILKLAKFLPQRFAAEKAIRSCTEENKRLRAEIDDLLSQIPPVPDTETVERWRREELQRMEFKCLEEIVNCEVNASNVGRFIRHKPIMDPVNGILIDSWGLLQPSRVHGPFGVEKTGLERAHADTGFGVVTFRGGTGPEPLYRLMYLQYMYLLEKNLNVYGFFYDFVTRKQYGKRSESYQYNHVTNFSIRDIELEEEAWVKSLGLSVAIRGTLFGKEITAVSLAVASGANFRCVLVDEGVVHGMNEWLGQQEKWAELEAEAKNQEERERLLKEIAKEKRHFKERGVKTARLALQQVRQQVEQYASLRS